MVNQFLDLFDTGREGRNLIFQTFLDRFKQPTRVPFNNFGGGQGELQRPGLVTDFNRPFFSNLFGQAQNEFLGRTGTNIQNQQEAPTFTEFLNSDFNLARRARRAPVGQMGTGVARFSGPARFLFNQ